MTSIDTSGIKIIPVHLNVVFASEYFSINSNLDEKKFISISREMNVNELYILDFFSIRNTQASDLFAGIADYLLGKKVLMINLNNSTYKMFLGYFGDSVFDFAKDGYGICLRTKQFPRDTDLPVFFGFSYLYNFLERKCRENIPVGDYPIWISSNVYINKHFDLKKMFGNMDTVKVIVYLMALKMEEWEDKKGITDYKLISSSFTGCILANLLSLIIGKEHISLPHLGPEPVIIEKDHRYMDYIKKEDKFVYIYDFIALGNEQKTVSVITNSLNAEIVYSLGLAYFKPTYKEIGRTEFLVDFKKIVDRVYIAAEKEDLIKIIGETNA